MFISWLAVRDVRCYEELDFAPEPGVNVLVGDNGAGKTSVLEAIGYVGMMKSFRGVSDDALVREGAGAAVIRAGVGGGATETTVETELPTDGRGLHSNASRYIHEYQTVAMRPNHDTQTAAGFVEVIPAS